jgi:hypothetical protein
MLAAPWNADSRRRTDLLRFADGKRHRQSHNQSCPSPPAILGCPGVRQMHGCSISTSYAKGLQVKNALYLNRHLRQRKIRG